MKGWRRRDGRAGHRRAMAKGEDERASERLTLANTFQASSSLFSPFAWMMRDMHAPRRFIFIRVSGRGKCLQFPRKVLEMQNHVCVPYASASVRPSSR